MNLPDPKALKKLVETCRKVGIKTFKGEGFEFTLTDESPKVVKQKQVTAPVIASTPDEFDSGPIMTEEQMLYWSTTAEDEHGNTGV